MLLVEKREEGKKGGENRMTARDRAQGRDVGRRCKLGLAWTPRWEEHVQKSTFP